MCAYLCVWLQTQQILVKTTENHGNHRNKYIHHTNIVYTTNVLTLSITERIKAITENKAFNLPEYRQQVKFMKIYLRIITATLQTLKLILLLKHRKYDLALLKQGVNSWYVISDNKRHLREIPFLYSTAVRQCHLSHSQSAYRSHRHLSHCHLSSHTNKQTRHQMITTTRHLAGKINYHSYSTQQNDTRMTTIQSQQSHLSAKNLPHFSQIFPHSIKHSLTYTVTHFSTENTQ